jgi:hypothetical protein
MLSDAVLNNLYKWTTRPEWTDILAAVMRAHFGPVPEALGMTDLDEVAEYVGEDAYFSIWLASLADLMARSTEGETNLADDYIKRRGLRETATVRDYLSAHKGSVLSLYEVLEVGLEGALSLRDLIRGGDAIAVKDRDVSIGAEAGAHIAARVLTTRLGVVLGLGFLMFPSEDTEALRGMMAGMALQDAAPTVSAAWLDGYLSDEGAVTDEAIGDDD